MENDPNAPVAVDAPVPWRATHHTKYTFSFYTEKMEGGTNLFRTRFGSFLKWWDDLINWLNVYQGEIKDVTVIIQGVEQHQFNKSYDVHSKYYGDPGSAAFGWGYGWGYGWGFGTNTPDHILVTYELIEYIPFSEYQRRLKKSVNDYEEKKRKEREAEQERKRQEEERKRQEQARKDEISSLKSRRKTLVDQMQSIIDDAQPITERINYISQNPPQKKKTLTRRELWVCDGKDFGSLEEAEAYRKSEFDKAQAEHAKYNNKYEPLRHEVLGIDNRLKELGETP